MNIYSSPESHGLTEIAEIDTGESYEFNMVVLWRAETGELWAAADSGCSCPTPFEDHTFPTDFTLVRAVEDIDPMLAGLTGDAAVVADFRQRVRAALSP